MNESVSRRDREAERVDVDLLELAPGEGRCADRGAEIRHARPGRRDRGRDDVYAISEKPEVERLVGVDLEQLDVDDDLGDLLVVLFDDALGDGDLVRGVAQGDGVFRLVDRDARRLKERAQGVGDLGDVRVREEERPDDEVLVGLAVLRRVGGDQDRALVDDLVEVVLLAQQGLEGLLELDVGQDDRDVVVLQLRVEDDVDPRRVGERAVDLLDRLRLREVQVDGPVARRLEDGGRRPGPWTFFLSFSILDSALRSVSTFALSSRACLSSFAA